MTFENLEKKIISMSDIMPDFWEIDRKLIELKKKHPLSDIMSDFWELWKK